MVMPPIYVINLARSAERRASIEKQMLRLGLGFNYFPAWMASYCHPRNLPVLISSWRTRHVDIRLH